MLSSKLIPLMRPLQQNLIRRRLPLLLQARNFSVNEDQDDVIRKYSSSDNESDSVNEVEIIRDITEEEIKSKEAESDSDLTYSQEYYILHRKEILQRRREKEMEAKFGDYSARLVKRPKKNFLWGFGTQMHEESRSDHEFFTDGKLPTIRQLINFLEVYQMKDIQVVQLYRQGFN